MRWRWWLLGVAAAGGLGWAALRGAVPEVDAHVPREDPTIAPQGRSRRLHEVRKSCRAEDLRAFVEEQRRIAAAETEGGTQHRVLAEALMELAGQSVMFRGVRSGAVLFQLMPEPARRALDEGRRALERARALGDRSSESYRVEASLIGYGIRNLLHGLSVSKDLNAAIERALELDPRNPRAHFVLGCRYVMAPPLFGRDYEKALEHLDFAARGMPLDERPLIFAARAAYGLGRRGQALELLDQAVARTPANRYAREVARRLRAGEDAPFTRDVH